MVLSQGNILNCRCLFHRLMWVLWQLIPAFHIALPITKIFKNGTIRSILVSKNSCALNFRQISISSNNYLNSVSNSASYTKPAFLNKSLLNTILKAEYWQMHNNYIYSGSDYNRFTGRLHLNNDYYSAHISAVQ